MSETATPPGPAAVSRTQPGAVEGQSQPLQRRSTGTTADVHTSNTPVPVSTILQRHHTQDTSSSQEHANQANNTANAPSIVSNAWALFVDRVVPITGFLGLILVLTFGIGTWVGMNYANSYSKRQYDLALFAACHEYKDIRETTFCEEVINAGITPRGLTKRHEGAAIEEPACIAQRLDSLLIAAKLLQQTVSTAASWTMAATARRQQKSTMYFVLWSFPMSLASGQPPLPASHGLNHFILAAGRVILFISWQVLLLGSSRFSFVGSGISIIESLPEALQVSPIAQKLPGSLLIFDVALVALAQVSVRWAATTVFVLGVCIAGFVYWARMRDAKGGSSISGSSASTAAPTIIVVGCILLLGVFFPCGLLRAMQAGSLCCCACVTFARVSGWRALVDRGSIVEGIRLVIRVLILLGALLDPFGPSIVTALFYGEYCV
ncbi:hypothetical protein BJY00DRAFT_319267 [Aspergillus carlsbadensis]|nr:hypothetical protein BJY00DRAFT_319267 [Aspergillus carlsbadensis]